VFRILIIVLLALLPLQFSWAAVASYCAHESMVAARHLGHYDHQRGISAGSIVDQAADRVANSESITDVAADLQGDEAPDLTDLDCGHCHGYCGAMPTVSSALAITSATLQPGAGLDEARGAHAPTRPERPQWWPLA
jgi:hypothetical protein